MNAETLQRVGVQPVQPTGGYGGGTHACCTGYTGVARTLHGGLHACPARASEQRVSSALLRFVSRVAASIGNC